ncbi:16S rRNA processing protein RimM [candidate division KSB1 bacterium]|nr:16S rRNA processing protein RimM [candidate division KSB1 bacterium]
MSSERERRLPDYIVIGQIIRAHGIHGEVKVLPHTDHPERFKLLDRVFLTIDEVNRTPYFVQNIRLGSRYIIVKFKDVNTPEHAGHLRKAFLEIPRQECLPLEDGKYYYFELIGLDVITKSGDKVGYVENILNYPANDIFVVQDGKKEYLIPDVPSIVEKIDLDRGLIIINPVDGLFDI